MYEMQMTRNSIQKWIFFLEKNLWMKNKDKTVFLEKLIQKNYLFSHSQRLFEDWVSVKSPSEKFFCKKKETNSYISYQYYQI